MQVDVRKIIASSVGSFLEWYDFSLYAFLAPYLAHIFFPPDNSYALIYTYSIFAVTYFARPLGGLFFGHFVDKYSRKKVLVFAMAIMGVSTALIGLIPTFSAIGWWAPIILLILRFIQGFSIGGDYTESMVYLIEHGETGGRGKLGSYINMALSLGALCSPLIIVLTRHIFDPSTWWMIGWRIPFFLGILAAGVGIYVRLKLGESPQFQKLIDQHNQSQSPIKETFSTAKGTLIKCFIYAIYVGVSFYIILIFLNTWYIHFEDMSLTRALIILFFALIVNIIGCYIGGVWSDLFGRKKVLYCTTSATAILIIPIFFLIQRVLFPQDKFFWIIVCESLLIGFNGVAMGTLPATFVELFPARIRGSAIAFSYNFALGIFGGTAPLICLLMYRATHSLVWPASYCALVSLIAFINTFTIKETALTDLQA